MTPHDRPFRFGLLSGAGTAAQWREDVARAEGEGYASIVLTDHLDLSGAHVTRLAWLPALADAAARTSHLHVCPMVANQDLRHPAVLGGVGVGFAGRSHPAALSAPRYLLLYLYATVFAVNATETGRTFGRDRTTVQNALRHIEKSRDAPAFEAWLQTLETILHMTPNLRGRA